MTERIPVVFTEYGRRDFDLKEVMICWTPPDFETHGNDFPPGSVGIGLHPDKKGWSDRFAMTHGACACFWRGLNKKERELEMFMIFHAMIVRDGISPEVAHAAFMSIKEFAKLIAADIEGSTLGE